MGHIKNERCGESYHKYYTRKYVKLQGGEYLIYITGDTHGDFRNVDCFCEKMQTNKDDVLIILGDAGINYYSGEPDAKKKEYLESLPITIFAIHGNHEMRPQSIPTYHEVEWCGGMVFVEDEYPHILFAKDGELYNIGGQRTFVIGGAYSVDKAYRLLHRLGWWPDEQPSDEIKRRVEEKLERLHWNVDIVLTHTAPLRYEPVEVFLHGLNQSMVDKSTEQWLHTIEERLDYQKWYCGHYHTIKKIDRIEFMFDNFDEFPEAYDDSWDNYDWCYECTGYGNEAYLNDDGELVSNCDDCPYNRDEDDYE